ncbi:MAG: hypothetical protein ACT4PV_05695 [Planctomycetaceae bacterium]
MRRLALFLVFLAAPLVAGPYRGGRAEEAEMLRRWPDAGPEERRRMEAALEEIERARRFVDAPCVLVETGGRLLPLAELFVGVLEPALELPPLRGPESGLGLRDEHRAALEGLAALQGAYRAPQPVGSGTLNLLLAHAASALDAPALTDAVRLRFFLEAVRCVQVLEGRVRPDARTAWLVRERLLPSLLALDRRTRADPAAHDSLAEGASILCLPALLDDDSQAQLAPLAGGVHARAPLLRAYRRRSLDGEGLLALSRSVDAQGREDAAFVAGAPPLLLELLCEPALPARERRLLMDLVLDRLAPLPPLRETCELLLAAGHGEPPRPLAEFAASRDVAMPAPETTADARRFRLLHVLLQRATPEATPMVARVVRLDLPLFWSCTTEDGAGGKLFLGVLLPSRSQDYPDFVGPSPGSAGRDNRLLRRPLRLERLAVTFFGSREEEIELVAALPEDGSEPVPARGATLGHVLDLVAARLARTQEEEERRDLVRFLARMGSEPAERLAALHARTPETLAELLPWAERGRALPLQTLLEHAELLRVEALERVLVAATREGNEANLAAAYRLCAERSLAVAVLAAQTLLAQGDGTGVMALLQRKDGYARVAGTALALRLSPVAGSLRADLRVGPDAARLCAAAMEAFGEREERPIWRQYGAWLALAFRDPDRVRALRRDHQRLYLGRREVRPVEFAEHYRGEIEEGRASEKLIAGLIAGILGPEDPGKGIPEPQLGALLDALEKRCRAGALRLAWLDALTLLACAQSGMEADTRFLDLAHARLLRAAGEKGAEIPRRMAGVLWPAWTASEASR